MTPLEARNKIAEAYQYASFMDLLVACVNNNTPKRLEDIIEECMTHYASFIAEEAHRKPAQSYVSCSLWEYGTVWVTSPVTDVVTTHKARRHKIHHIVEFFHVAPTCDNGIGFWSEIHECWWVNFIPTN